MAKAKKTLKKKTPAQKAPPKKGAAKKPAAKKLLTKKRVVKKPTPKKTTKPATKKAAPKKSAPKKLAPKKLAPKKMVAKKPAAQKPAVRKIIARTAARKGPPGLPEHMLEAALKVLDERQAEDIVTVDLAGRSAMADYMIIASGRASKQLGAIAHYLREEFEKLGATQMRIEGMSEGNWVLMDAGDIIVHLFRPEVRRYYNLEQIWDRSGRSSETSSRDDEE